MDKVGKQKRRNFPSTTTENGYLNGEDIEINGKIVKTPQNPPCIIVNYVLFLVRNKKVFFRAG